MGIILISVLNLHVYQQQLKLTPLMSSNLLCFSLDGKKIITYSRTEHLIFLICQPNKHFRFTQDEEKRILILHVS